MLYQNGVGIADTGYRVTLSARNDQTQHRLKHSEPNQWVDPTYADHHLKWMFAWIDPRHSQTGGCGNESQYMSGDTASRGPEVHWPGPNSAPAGKERHCIQPGNYTLYLFHNGALVQRMDLDYVPAAGAPDSILSVWNASANVAEKIEAQDYDDTTYHWHDLDVQVDVGSPGYSDTPVFYGDQTDDISPYSNLTFTDAAWLAGNQYTWFRFSSVASTTSETTNIFGRLLSRVYWDSAGNLQDRTGFWDSHSNDGIIRIHQFQTDSQRTGPYVVGLETKRPDEQPASAPQVTRVVDITLVGPPPPLSDVITGPDLISVSGTYGWQQTASGGVAPYTYGNWYFYRYGYGETLAGSGQYYSRYVATETIEYVFRLRALATDHQGTQIQARFFVDVLASGGGGKGAASATGVRLQDGSCGPRPASGPARQAWLQWVLEQRRGVVETCRLLQ